VVKYSARAWDGDTEASRTNDAIQIYYRLGDNGGWVEDQLGQFNADDSYQFTGTISLDRPLPDSVDVRATALHDWGNGAAGGQSQETGALTFSGCAAQPAATIHADCTGFTVDLSNTEGTAPADFTVTKPDTTTEDVTVPAGQDTTKTYPVTEDVAKTVTVSSGGHALATQTYTAHCAQTPTPSPAPPTTPPAQAPRPPAEVGGVQQAAHATPRARPVPVGTVAPSQEALPNTGSPVNPLMLTAGAGAFLVGGALMVLSRRRRRG
jgi:LPXTG-motif cell wall-anchored protein